MVLTPRAEALKARVHAVVTEARQTLEPQGPFWPSELDCTFLMRTTDSVLTILGLSVDRILGEEAPRVVLRFLPNSPEDAAALRDGRSDLAIGTYAELPPDMRIRQILTDRLVAVVREGHPDVGEHMSIEQFVRLQHLQVAPRGRPGGYLDDVLGEGGRARRVARVVPYFLPALQLASQTDYVLTVPERVARQLAPSLGLRLLQLPVKLRPYALNLVWHPRLDGDAGHAFLREVFVRAAREAAEGPHEGASSRPESTGPASGPMRRRP